MSLYSLTVIIIWALVHCTSGVSIQFDGYNKMGFYTTVRLVLMLVHCTSDVSIQFDGYNNMGVSPLYIWCLYTV